MRWILSLIFIILGLLLSIYYKRVTEIVGFRIGWAERYLGSTYYAYFLFGLIGFILGLLILFGVIDFGWLD